ncbi:MAG TPA: hypothetical protein VFO76_04165 [Candidatus Kapabacteria bacterium]|nr:hypothetical protein [Candidatus Kapabacteria bacterium]
MKKLQKYFAGIVIAISIAGCGLSGDPFGEFRIESKFFGANGEHFEAVINGTDWWPQGRFSSDNFASPLTLSFLQQPAGHHSFELFVERDFEPQSTLRITVDTMYGLGFYKLGDRLQGSWAVYDRVDTLSDKSLKHTVFSTDSIRTGSMLIQKIDTSLHLITGQVVFDASGDGTVLHLKDGSFIAQYQF